jgi:hypothetical protein
VRGGKADYIARGRGDLVRSHGGGKAPAFKRPPVATRSGGAIPVEYRFSCACLMRRGCGSQGSQKRLSRANKAVDKSEDAVLLAEQQLESAPPSRR